jgi:hypothetical protein
MKAFEKLRSTAGRMAKSIGIRKRGQRHPVRAFHTNEYLRHNARRLEHLASLGLQLSGSTVLEVGAGIGDHSSFYLDRDCDLTITEAREENLELIRSRYPDVRVVALDMEKPGAFSGGPFDIVHCYGLLYHLSEPASALRFLAANTRRLLLLETCVSFGEASEIRNTPEIRNSPTQAFSGLGCRPTRPWVFNQLKTLFPHVYIPKTQPNHEEFPIDWRDQENHSCHLQRAVFVGSREKLENSQLSDTLLECQIRQG